MRFRPAMLVVLTFGALILAGTVLLQVLIHRSGQANPEIITSAFTSVSAVCVTGLIVEATRLDGEPPVPAEAGRGELARLDKVLDPNPVLSPAMIATLLESAEELLCPIGLALAAALPPGSAPRIIRQLRLTPRGREALHSNAAPSATRALLARLERGPVAATKLGRGLENAASLIRMLSHDGLIASHSTEQPPGARPATQRVASLSPGLDAEAICREDLARAPKQAELLRRIAREGEIPTANLSGDFKAPADLLRALARRGFIRLHERRAPRQIPSLVVPKDKIVELTSEQAAALEPIRKSIRERRQQTFLLHGVTGSGKTEVYAQAVAEALATERQALVLVPEITLTHQIVARLRARFGDRLAVLHSGLRPGERLEQWQRLRNGEAPIAVGARSALFAPLERLGVIVIDEEHDPAYKNAEGFRYHARDLADKRARRAKCPVILGSATPAMETRTAAERGEIQRLVLARRIGGRPLPAVQIIDMARERERAPRGRKLILTRPLRRALAETLEVGGQSILFLNRRGFSTQIFCFDCGFAERCKDCDVALVYHASNQTLRCHYCNFSKPPPQLCGGCGAPDTALLGVGTQRLEEEVRSLLPSARLARLDSDTASRRGYTESLLDSLRAGELDILVGTQMVAKGHDFPGVQLVGVVAADLGLHMPDFRAAERTFQVLTQVAGRAGRAAAPGRVLLQTFTPDHYAIGPVRTHDYEGFYTRELRYRRELGYPPFGRLSQVLVSGPDPAETAAAAKKLGQLARAEAASCTAASGPGGARPSSPPADATAAAIQVLGPAPAPLARLRGRYRHQLLIKGADARAVQHTSRCVAQATGELPRGVRAVVDVNPGNML